MSRYILQKSEELGWWVVTDTELQLVYRFRAAEFNESQQVTWLNGHPKIGNAPNANAVAKANRQLADWVAAFHYDLAMGSPLPPRVAIGRQLAWWRNERGLSVRALAEKCGVANQSISAIETARYNASLEVLGRITSALGIDLMLTDREE